jgi:predicted lysophospholipase L1 biosynthesis ABC-type transport system permease subunit
VLAGPREGAITVRGSRLEIPFDRHRLGRRHRADDSSQMSLERSRLFLLIALGEAILTAGSTVAWAEPSAGMFATATLCRPGTSGPRPPAVRPEARCP